MPWWQPCHSCRLKPWPQMRYAKRVPITQAPGESPAFSVHVAHSRIQRTAACASPADLANTLLTKGQRPARPAPRAPTLSAIENRARPVVPGKPRKRALQILRHVKRYRFLLPSRENFFYSTTRALVALTRTAVRKMAGGTIFGTAARVTGTSFLALGYIRQISSVSKANSQSSASRSDMAAKTQVPQSNNILAPRKMRCSVGL